MAFSRVNTQLHTGARSIYISGIRAGGLTYLPMGVAAPRSTSATLLKQTRPFSAATISASSTSSNDFPGGIAHLDGFAVRERIPVRWRDMDAMNHVNNALYFTYFESTRVAHFAKLKQVAADVAADGDDLSFFDISPHGVGPILSHTECFFKAPVKYPDDLLVGTRVRALGDTSFDYAYRAVSRKLGRVAAEGSAKIVTFDYTAGARAPVPGAVAAAIRALDGPLEEG